MLSNEVTEERVARDRMIARISLDLVRRMVLNYNGKRQELKKYLLSQIDSWLSDLDKRLESVIYDLATRP